MPTHKETGAKPFLKTQGAKPIIEEVKPSKPPFSQRMSLAKQIAKGYKLELSVAAAVLTTLGGVIGYGIAKRS